MMEILQGSATSFNQIGAPWWHLNQLRFNVPLRPINSTMFKHSLGQRNLKMNTSSSSPPLSAPPHCFSIHQESQIYHQKNLWDAKNTPRIVLHQWQINSNLTATVGDISRRPNESSLEHPKLLLKKKRAKKMLKNDFKGPEMNLQFQKVNQIPSYKWHF